MRVNGTKVRLFFFQLLFSSFLQTFLSSRNRRSRFLFAFLETKKPKQSMIGHLLGAAGAVEAVAAVQAIVTGKLHPTLNVEDPAPSIDMSVVVGPGARERDQGGFVQFFRVRRAQQLDHLPEV